LDRNRDFIRGSCTLERHRFHFTLNFRRDRRNLLLLPESLVRRFEHRLQLFSRRAPRHGRRFRRRRLAGPREEVIAESTKSFHALFSARPSLGNLVGDVIRQDDLSAFLLFIPAHEFVRSSRGPRRRRQGPILHLGRDFRALEIFGALRLDIRLQGMFSLVEDFVFDVEILSAVPAVSSGWPRRPESAVVAHRSDRRLCGVGLRRILVRSPGKREELAPVLQTALLVAFSPARSGQSFC